MGDARLPVLGSERRKTSWDEREAPTESMRQGSLAVVLPVQGRLVLWAALAAGALARVPGLLGSTAAAEPLEPIRIVYDAGPGCPSSSDLEAEVRARTSRARLAGPDERARGFAIRIVQARDGFRGRLDVREPDGALSTREVSGESCAEVASALALVMALAVDPQATLVLRARPAVASASPAALPADALDAGTTALDASATDAATEPETAADASAPAPPPKPSAVVAPVSKPSPSEPDLYAGRPVRAFVGLAYGARTGLGASLTGASGMLLEAGLPPRGLLAPALRLSLEHALGTSVATPSGSLAHFELTTAHLDACVVRLPLGPVDLAPCAAFGLGALHAVGRVRRVEVPRTRPWADAAFTARARMVVLGRLSFEVDGGLSVPFVRDTFVFEPATTVHETPPAAALFGGAAAVRLW